MIACTEQTGLFLTAACTLMLLLTAGCATVHQPPAPPSAPREQPLPHLPEPPSDPRSLASLQLTEQGRALLQQRRYDDAIRVLDRAVGLHPMNGENYYYLAEAWLAKGRLQQAEEFSRLAEMYLGGPRWSERLIEQRRAIDSRRSPP